MLVPETPKSPFDSAQGKPLDVAPRILEELAKTIPVLDKSQHGWWRLAVLAIVGGAIACSIIWVQKMEPQPPQSDSACRLVGSAIVCD